MEVLMKAKLTLIPTPIDEESSLEQTAFDLLATASKDLVNNTVLVEDIKPCRRRWIRWGLSRDVVDSLVPYNEHNQETLIKDIIKKIQKGHNVYLMSDGGLPAFCDPGQKLVRACHESGVKVTSAPFSNSISLAVSLSGIDCSQFFFAGFLPRKTEARAEEISNIANMPYPVILMDTPYRLEKLLSEIKEAGVQRKVFLGMNLNSEEEELHFGSISSIHKRVKGKKAEFILILE
jgi:16S rRNA (cytidine1402-2'-O)-methyltransferase